MQKQKQQQQQHEEPVAKLLCPGKIDDFAAICEGPRRVVPIPSTRPTPCGLGEKKERKWPQKGDFNGQMSFATGSGIMTALIIGLGNPGKEYAHTRHNIGRRAAEEFARVHELIFRRKFLIKGALARGQHLLVLLPNAYMNVCGAVIAKAKARYAVPLDRILVLVDDVAIPFGELRLRGSGGSGGHNGLKSVEEQLGQGYARLRIGVGDRREGDLAEYVLSSFSLQEEQLIPSILERVVKGIDLWLKEDLNRAMNELHRDRLE